MGGRRSFHTPLGRRFDFPSTTLCIMAVVGVTGRRKEEEAEEGSFHEDGIAAEPTKRDDWGSLSRSRPPFAFFSLFFFFSFWSFWWCGDDDSFASSSSSPRIDLGECGPLGERNEEGSEYARGSVFRFFLVDRKEVVDCPAPPPPPPPLSGPPGRPLRTTLLLLAAVIEGVMPGEPEAEEE